MEPSSTEEIVEETKKTQSCRDRWNTRGCYKVKCAVLSKGSDWTVTENTDNRGLSSKMEKTHCQRKGVSRNAETTGELPDCLSVPARVFKRVILERLNVAFTENLRKEQANYRECKSYPEQAAQVASLRISVEQSLE
ncbi:hypothetical protein ElyMa_006641300 [Elysia marginata]|uniref:Uncharacterized protein n=1 Tax=Elysia marginata TaxID=1093978 RepID=A0AAV4IKC0_9GAST|nr:hypothetical protein ElyMa_006641300 [Elysia marginata]